MEDTNRDYTPEEMEAWADQLRRSGRYSIQRTDTSTPAPERYVTHNITPTPIREYQRRGATFGAEFLPPHDIPRRPPPPHMSALYPYSFMDNSYSAPPHRLPQLSQFSGEGQKGDCTFEVWRYDVNCLLRGHMYPEHAILEAIRKSLKGKARTVLLHLGELANINDIMTELEGLYGNVATSEKLKEQFYCARQEKNETVADYSLRLEQLLCNSNMNLDYETKNEMLRNRLWSGLRDSELRNVSRFKFETVNNFNRLRKELRQIEQDLEVTKLDTTKTIEVKEPQKATQFMTAVESKLLQQLEELTTQMRKLNTKVDNMDKEIQDLKKEKESSAQDKNRGWQNKRWGNKDTDKTKQNSQQKGEKKTGDSTKEQKDLNQQGPPSKGR